VAGQPVGVVIGQIPPVGSYLTALDTEQLVLARPTHGTVPNVVGMPTQKALDLLAGRGLEPVVSGLVQAGGSSERVLAQEPRAGVAAGSGLGVKLFVAR
jgi:beta-lactam-binding protein with PASTA domain